MTAVVSRLMIVAAAVCVAVGWGASHELLAEERAMKIVVLGDSLTAGYGLPATDAFPAKLELVLKGRGLAATIVNAGVSGDTAAMGLARLDRSITKDTNAVIVELGANDMLIGFTPDATRAALAEILQNLKARRVAVLLCGVRTEPAFGAEIRESFCGDVLCSCQRAKCAVLPGVR